MIKRVNGGLKPLQFCKTKERQIKKILQNDREVFILKTNEEGQENVQKVGKETEYQMLEKEDLVGHLITRDPGMINLSSWQHIYGNTDRRDEEMRHSTFELEK